MAAVPRDSSLTPLRTRLYTVYREVTRLFLNSDYPDLGDFLHIYKKFLEFRNGIGHDYVCSHLSQITIDDTHNPPTAVDAT
jgi:hypothetical protein